MPTFTYDKDIGDLPVQPRPLDFGPDRVDTQLTGEELDARDRGSADSVRDYNLATGNTGGRVVGTADAGDLYGHYSD